MRVLGSLGPRRAGFPASIPRLGRQGCRVSLQASEALAFDVCFLKPYQRDERCYVSHVGLDARIQVQCRACFLVCPVLD